MYQKGTGKVLLKINNNCYYVDNLNGTKYLFSYEELLAVARWNCVSTTKNSMSKTSKGHLHKFMEIVGAKHTVQQISDLLEKGKVCVKDNCVELNGIKYFASNLIIKNQQHYSLIKLWKNCWLMRGMPSYLFSYDTLIAIDRWGCVEEVKFPLSRKNKLHLDKYLEYIGCRKTVNWLVKNLDLVRFEGMESIYYGKDYYSLNEFSSKYRKMVRKWWENNAK